MTDRKGTRLDQAVSLIDNDQAAVMLGSSSPPPSQAPSTASRWSPGPTRSSRPPR